VETFLEVLTDKIHPNKFHRAPYPFIGKTNKEEYFMYLSLSIGDKPNMEEYLDEQLKNLVDYPELLMLYIAHNSKKKNCCLERNYKIKNFKNRKYVLRSFLTYSSDQINATMLVDEPKQGSSFCFYEHEKSLFYSLTVKFVVYELDKY